MKLKKVTGRNAVFKLEKGEGFEDIYKYMVILDYDEAREYDGTDGDVYKKTYKEAVDSAYAWEH